MVRQVWDWIVNLRGIPSGGLTKGASWVGLIVSGMCAFGIPIPGVGCPLNPQEAFGTALLSAIGIGLGRRK